MTNIQTVMKQTVVIIITACILIGFFIFSHSMVDNISSNKLAFSSLIIIFTVIIYSVYLAKDYVKTGFLFEVTPNKQRCSIGYNGLPHLNFEYIPDAERVTMSICNEINEQNKIKLHETPKDTAAKDDELIRQNAFLY